MLSSNRSAYQKGGLGAYYPIGARLLNVQAFRGNRDKLSLRSDSLKLRVDESVLKREVRQTMYKGIKIVFVVHNMSSLYSV